MTKPSLTVERLISSGFAEVGCWELNSTRDLAHPITVPHKAGVYAFAIDGIVQYVGLASKSLRQRFGFYRKPGASQATNIRLNEIIRGQIDKGVVVQILTAHPPDHEWNGFKVSGSEGLEAGIIAEFDLPWNKRGGAVVTQNPLNTASPSQSPRQRGVATKIVELVRRRPGMTELEIAKAIHGPSAVQQHINQDCRILVVRGFIQRRGAGGRADPYVYYPTQSEQRP